MPRHINVYRLKDEVVFHVTGNGPDDVALTAEAARIFASHLRAYADDIENNAFTESSLALMQMSVTAGAY